MELATVIFAGIGMLTGVGALALSYLSYERVRHIKALDLRLEANRARNDADVAMAHLAPLIKKAESSRVAVAAATGRYHSGAMQLWKKQWQEDQSRADELAAEIPNKDIDYDVLEAKELEDAVVRLHRTKGWIDDLIQKYESELLSDDHERNQIREDHRAFKPSHRSSIHGD